MKRSQRVIATNYKHVRNPLISYRLSTSVGPVAEPGLRRRTVNAVRKPSEPEIRGSNPRGPAIFCL